MAEKIPRSGRWAGTTRAERSELLRKAREAASLAARRRRIDELIELAPDFTEEQRARLAVLLGSGES